MGLQTGPEFMEGVEWTVTGLKVRGHQN